MQRLDGSLVTSESMRGKVVLLDFFATWCAPCRAELPELDRLRRELGGQADIEILVVADGSDTVEAIRRFAGARAGGLPFAYDTGGKVHESLGFSGLPALVVLDRNGRIRMTHQGYNKADTGFRVRLAAFLRSL